MDSTPSAISILTSAVRPGWQTSEFWLSLLGIGSAIAVPIADPAVQRATGQLAQHGTLGVMAAAAIAAAYAVGRSAVKSATAKALLTPVPPPVEITTDSAPTSASSR